MRKVVIIIGVILLLGIISFGFASLGLNDIKAMEINEVDLTRLEDGVYAGRFHKVRWTHEVEVTVKDHRIIAIKNTNNVSTGVVDRAIEAIIARQSVIIDVVSGATVNTRAFQKAVENALIEGNK